jgi:hypothetical protein
MEHRWVRRTIRLGWALLVLLVLYVLSIGPVNRMNVRAHDSVPGYSTPAAIGAFYEPLLSVYDVAPEPVQDVMIWYVELWDPAPAD